MVSAICMVLESGGIKLLESRQVTVWRRARMTQRRGGDWEVESRARAANVGTVQCPTQNHATIRQDRWFPN
jgi:hypothetical protein